MSGPWEFNPFLDEQTMRCFPGARHLFVCSSLQELMLGWRHIVCGARPHSCHEHGGAMNDAEVKAQLHGRLHGVRQALVWKLDGLGAAPRNALIERAAQAAGG